MMASKTRQWNVMYEIPIMAKILAKTEGIARGEITTITVKAISEVAVIHNEATLIIHQAEFMDFK